MKGVVIFLPADIEFQRIMKKKDPHFAGLFFSLNN